MAGIVVRPSGLGYVLAPSVIVAFGLGFSFVPLVIAATAGTTGKDAGLASGLINTAQQLGGALGLAVLSTLATARTKLDAVRAGPRAEHSKDGIGPGERFPAGVRG